MESPAVLDLSLAISFLFQDGGNPAPKRAGDWPLGSRPPSSYLLPGSGERKERAEWPVSLPLPLPVSPWRAFSAARCRLYCPHALFWTYPRPAGHVLCFLAECRCRELASFSLCVQSISLVLACRGHSSWVGNRRDRCLFSSPPAAVAGYSLVRDLGCWVFLTTGRQASNRAGSTTRVSFFSSKYDAYQKKCVLYGE